MKRLFVGAIATFFATFSSIASAEQITIEKISKQVITSSLDVADTVEFNQLDKLNK